MKLPPKGELEAALRAHVQTTHFFDEETGAVRAD